MPGYPDPAILTTNKRSMPSGSALLINSATSIMLTGRKKGNSLHSHEREALVPKGTFLAVFQEATRVARAPLRVCECIYMGLTQRGRHIHAPLPLPTTKKRDYPVPGTYRTDRAGDYPPSPPSLWAIATCQPQGTSGGLF